jgi:hypothetical protein
MQRLEIRDYEGDFEDIVDLAHRVWVPEYGGRIWIPLPEAAFLRQKAGPQTGGVCKVAYENERLTGSIFSVPRVLRVAGKRHQVSLYTGFSVEPSSRRAALPLIERLRRTNEERGDDFGIGMVLDDPTSASYRFWTKYAEAFPRSFRFVFRGGYLAKFLRPDVLARAGIMAWERVASRAFGPILRLSPTVFDPNIRSYRASDLARCSEIVERMSRGLDWAMEWPPDQLAGQLGGPESTTLVYERDGIVQGLVSSHGLPLLGRKMMRCAFIDLWAHDDLNAVERLRLVAHLCRQLRTTGTDAVIAPRSATMPTGALLANLFLPAAQHFRIGIFQTRRTPDLAPPKSWSFEIT